MRVIRIVLAWIQALLGWRASGGEPSPVDERPQARCEELPERPGSRNLTLMINGQPLEELDEVDLDDHADDAARYMSEVLPSFSESMIITTLDGFICRWCGTYTQGGMRLASLDEGLMCPVCGSDDIETDSQRLN